MMEEKSEEAPAETQPVAAEARTGPGDENE